MVIVVQPSPKLIFGHSPLAEMFLGFAHVTPRSHFIFLLQQEIEFLSAIPGNVSIEKIPFTSHNKLTDYYWRRLKLPAYLQKKKVDHFITDVFPAGKYGQTQSVYLSPQNFTPPVFIAPPTAFSAASEESFFACLLNHDTMGTTVMVLKAFSLFKKRLRSGYKLYFISEAKDAQKMIPGFENYKYKEDVLVITMNDLAQFQFYAKNALGFLYFPTKQFDEFLLRTILQQGSVVITKNYQNLSSYLQNAVIPVPLTTEELADKMMLLYKDENLQAAHRSMARRNISSETNVSLQTILAGEYDYLKPV